MADSSNVSTLRERQKVDPVALVHARLTAVVDRLNVALQFSEASVAACSQTLHAIRFAMQGRDEYKDFDLGEGGVHLHYGEAEALVQALLPLVAAARREVDIAACRHERSEPAEVMHMRRCPDCTARWPVESFTGED